MGTVTIHETRFLEPDDPDTWAGPDYQNDTETTIYTDVSASEAARILERHGLSFEATGNAWAADPDGSYIINYATAERIETSGHLDGFPARVLGAIMRKVG